MAAYRKNASLLSSLRKHRLSSFLPSSTCYSHNWKSNMALDFSSDAGQPTHATHPHLLSPNEVLPGVTSDEFAHRRRSVAERMPAGSVMMIPSAPVQFMAGIVPYPYRQDADYLYLTGCGQPGGVAVLEKSRTSGATVFQMYMRESSPEEEVWNGRTAGVKAAMETFGADRAFPISNLQNDVARWTQDGRSVLYNVRSPSNLHSEIPALSAAAMAGKVKSPLPLLHDARWKKSGPEARLIRHSASIICQAMLRGMHTSTESQNENDVLTAVEYECRRRGSQRMAFPSVVASGRNGCTVHYSRADEDLTPGDLLLVDAGCEYFGYVSDVTRVWSPAGGFSDAQLEVYEEVLGVMKCCIEMCVPGNNLRQIHKYSVQKLSESLSRLKILKMSPTEIARGAYKNFYPTSVGHWLGLDTHDCSFVDLGRPLEPGVVLTIEPGLYIHTSSTAPERYKGIGIRIEDDILITDTGNVNLTASLPKEVGEIEAWIRQSSMMRSN